MDRRHKWKAIKRSKYTTRYVCRVCSKRDSKVHDVSGKLGYYLKRVYTPAIKKMLFAETSLTKHFVPLKVNDKEAIFNTKTRSV